MKSKIITKVLMMAMAVLTLTSLTGCGNPFVRYVFVYPRMPVLSVKPKPILSNLNGAEMTPYKVAVDYAKKAFADGIMDNQEQEDFKKLSDEAMISSKMAHFKLVSNFNQLILWSEQNLIAVRLYNDYARAMNDSNKFYSSQSSSAYTDEYDKYESWYKPKE